MTTREPSWWPGPSLEDRRTVCAVLAEALARGGDLDAALARARLLVSGRTAQRLAAVRTAVARGEPLIDPLVREGLLVAADAGHARAAAAAGPAALAAFFRERAPDETPDWSPLFPAAVTAAGTTLLLLWLGVMVFPRLRALFRAEEVIIPARTDAVMTAAAWFVDGFWGWALALLLLGALIGNVLGRRLQQRRARRDRAAILLAGVAAGRDEATLAEDLAADPALAAAGVRAAGATGDFAALCRICGWRAATPAALAAAVQAEAARRTRRDALLMRTAGALAPLALAVPVWWMATGFWQGLLAALQAAADWGTP